MTFTELQLSLNPLLLIYSHSATVLTDILHLYLIYRPPKPSKDFIDEIAVLLSELFIKYDRLIILGDLNIHICCGSDSLSKDFLNLIE